eukprot:6248073-Prymnesium_polylepis.2
MSLTDIRPTDEAKDVEKIGNEIVVNLSRKYDKDKKTINRSGSRREVKEAKLRDLELLTYQGGGLLPQLRDLPAASSAQCSTPCSDATQKQRSRTADVPDT